MGLRTPQEYKASLQDDRVIYYKGERVKDVTTHPVYAAWPCSMPALTIRWLKIRAIATWLSCTIRRSAKISVATIISHAIVTTY